MTDTTTSPLAATLRTFANAFETGTRTSTGEPFYKLKDDAPAWIKGDSGYDAMHAIHCEVDGTDSPRLPDDWIYEKAAFIADDLATCAENDEDVADAVHEVVDGHVDIYNAGLTAWLARSLQNIHLVEAGRDEYGVEDNLPQMIQNGQRLALERIAYAILELCEARAEELDNENALGAADDESFAATYDEAAMTADEEG